MALWLGVCTSEFSQKFWNLSVLLGFLNLCRFSLNKAQLSLHLEINSHLVAECNVLWHWLFVISLTQTNSNCDLETFDKWTPSERGQWYCMLILSEFSFTEICVTDLGNTPCLACLPSAVTSQYLIFCFWSCSCSLGLVALSGWFLIACGQVALPLMIKSDWVIPFQRLQLTDDSSCCWYCNFTQKLFHAKPAMLGRNSRTSGSFRAGEKWVCTFRALLELFFWTYKSWIPFFMEQEFQQQGRGVLLSSLYSQAQFWGQSSEEVKHLRNASDPVFLLELW